jgi:phosphatidylethanolamine-binding protein (PEBP) family uncharacterized protein
MKLKIRKTSKRNRIRHKYKTPKRRKGGVSEFAVDYDGVRVAGQDYTKQATYSAPNVQFPSTGKLYTLIMWDPDVPPAKQPGWAHWIAINLKSPIDIHNNQLLDYSGPSPPSGMHRYFFGLFEQVARISPQQPQRQEFSVEKIIKDNNLTKVAQVFMRVPYG